MTNSITSNQDHEDKQLTLAKIARLIKHYQDGNIPTLSSHEVNPGHEIGSRENYLYFTLPVSINYQRSSPAMWASALKTYEDPKTRYLFYPEEVMKRSRDEIQKDLISNKLGLQKNRHTKIWISISKFFHEKFDNDPRELFAKNNFDVELILQDIQKYEITSLRGPKMSNYWLYILDKHTNIKLKNKNLISIIPDTHIKQASLTLGITEENDNSEVISQKWFNLLEESKINPVDLHPVLWNWSRNAFLPHV